MNWTKPWTEVTPRLTFTEGGGFPGVEVSEYEAPGVVANDPVYLASVASLGLVGYGAAALILVSWVLSLLVWLLRRLCCSRRRSDQAIYDDMYGDQGEGEDGLGGKRRRYSQASVDRVKVASLALILLGWLAALVSVLYATEAYTLTERGTDALQATASAQSLDLLGLFDKSADLKTAAHLERLNRVWQAVEGAVLATVRRNRQALDEAYVVAFCLVYIVPATSLCFFFWALLAVFRNHPGAVRGLLHWVAPFMAAALAAYFGASYALPSLYADVCAFAAPWTAASSAVAVEAVPGPLLTQQNLAENGAFAASLYPCASLDLAAALNGSTGAAAGYKVWLDAFELTRAARQRANSVMQGLNNDLEDLATRSDTWWMAAGAGTGGREVRLTFLCAPFEKRTVASEAECRALLAGAGAGAQPVSAARALACALHARGEMSLPVEVYEETQRCDHTEYKDVKPSFRFQYANQAADFSLSVAAGGYAEYAQMLAQYGFDLEEMAGRAAEAVWTAAKSGAPLRSAVCGDTAAALREMTQSGRRCEQLEHIADVLWVANAAVFLACGLLTVCLAVLKGNYKKLEILEKERRGGRGGERMVRVAEGIPATPPAQHMHPHQQRPHSPHAGASAPPMPMPHAHAHARPGSSLPQQQVQMSNLAVGLSPMQAQAMQAQARAQQQASAKARALEQERLRAQQEQRARLARQQQQQQQLLREQERQRQRDAFAVYEYTPPSRSKSYKLPQPPKG